MIYYISTVFSYWHTGLATVAPFVALSELNLRCSGTRILSGKEDVRFQEINPVTMERYAGTRADCGDTQRKQHLIG